MSPTSISYDNPQRWLSSHGSVPVGCTAAAFVGSRISEVVASDGLLCCDVIVTVFLRGGWDVMNVVPPIDGADRGFYEAARPNLKISNWRK